MTLLNYAGERNVGEEKSRVALLKFFIIVFPLWLSGKFYSGPYFEFVRNYLTAIILIIMLALVFQMVFTKARGERVVLCIVIILSLLQIAYFFFPSLAALVHFSLGSATFLGAKHSIHLIPYYGVGGFIAFFVLRSCRREESLSLSRRI